MPFGLQPLHLVIVLVVALLIFGPKRLPEIGRYIGKTLTEFRAGTQELSQTFREEINQTPTRPQSSTTAAQDAGNFCSKCGVPNGPEARFCGNCGAPLAQASEAA
jgi:sec-independent protein translocase protein TatA